MGRSRVSRPNDQNQANLALGRHTRAARPAAAWVRAAQARWTQTPPVGQALRGHSGAVIDAAFAADGRALATGTSGLQRDDAPARPAEVRTWERVE